MTLDVPGSMKITNAKGQALCECLSGEPLRRQSRSALKFAAVYIQGNTLTISAGALPTVTSHIEKQFGSALEGFQFNGSVGTFNAPRELLAPCL